MGLYIESGKVAYGKVVEFRVYNYRCVRALLDCKRPRLLIIILAFLFFFLAKCRSHLSYWMDRNDFNSSNRLSRIVSYVSNNFI